MPEEGTILWMIGVSRQPRYRQDEGSLRSNSQLFSIPMRPILRPLQSNLALLALARGRSCAPGPL